MGDQTAKREFSFGDGAVAAAYDAVLVPGLFAPWADGLVEDTGNWKGRKVLDLATGTGIVAQKLAGKVGAGGRVIGADINGKMLELARRRCSRCADVVRFIDSPAHPLSLADAAVDAVVCQQGFQFFPDRSAAAREIHRVLVPGGTVVATTWRPVKECQFFGWVCEALEKVDEPELAELMRAPFDFMPADELGDHFAGAGFDEVRVGRQERDFRYPGSPDEALDVAYATPIGAMLAGLSEDKQFRFRKELRRNLVMLCSGGTAMGTMVANVLTAAKPH